MGNTATYDPQPVTTAEEDWRQEPASQFRAGMLAGLALGFIPFAGVGEQLLDAADVLPQTQSFRQCERDRDRCSHRRACDRGIEGVCRRRTSKHRSGRLGADDHRVGQHRPTRRKWGKARF
jgi:hypothetical protein